MVHVIDKVMVLVVEKEATWAMMAQSSLLMVHAVETQAFTVPKALVVVNTGIAVMEWPIVVNS